MNSSHNLFGNVNGKATMKNSMNLPRNMRHRGVIWPCNPTYGPRSRECEVKVTQSCSTLCNTMDYTAHGIL